MRTGRFIALSFALAVTVTCAVSASSSVAEAQDKGDKGQDAGAPSLPACVSVGTEARYVPYGYNHIVVLKNGCSKAAACSVSTDVNPQAIAVDVAPAASVEVLTFSASPSQTFHARVTCKLH